MINTSTPPADDSGRRPPRRFGALVAVVVGVLILVLVGSAALAARSGLVSTGGTKATPSASGTQSATAQVRAVIQLANQEQQQAFAQDKPTLMRGTATAAYYAQLVALDTTLRSGGVTAIQLRSTTFDQVTVQSNTAHATTTETWQATFTGGSTTTNTTLNNYSLVLVSGAWKISGNTQPRTNIPPSSTSPGATPAASPTPGSAPTTVGSTSRNWSGYVATGGAFSGVRGTWTVPTVSATGTGVDATWVGIGGASTTDLIQAGTQATVDNGVDQYSAWIETLPQASQTVPLTVNAGDAITVAITQQSTGVWNITIQNATSGGSYTGSVTYASSLSSAEWIEEAPTSGGRVVLLDQFGTVQFTNLSAVENQQTVTPALVTRHPEQLRDVVAHEPPLLELLPDAEQLRAQTEDIYDTFRREGQGPAWLKFAALVAPDFDPADMFALQGPPSAEMIANSERMLAHSLRPTSLHRPDLAALRAVSDRIVVGVGATSAGQVANRTARALAACLDLPVVEFPGHHEGFVSDPEPFAAKLVEVLQGRA